MPDPFVPDASDLLGVDILAEIPQDAEPLDEEDSQGIVRRQVEQAQQWRSEHLDPEQEKATDYYMGRELGNEVKGRSQVVSTDVRDAVQSILPSLMRVFFGPDRVVEYEPQGPEDVPLAEQQTDYADYIIQRQNPGFSVFYSAFKDALVRKLGIVKFWYDDSEGFAESDHTDLSPEQVEFMLAQEEVIDVVPLEEEPGTFRVTRSTGKAQIRIACVPPEEFLFSPSARSLEDAIMVAHVRELPASDLIAMGVDTDMVERNKGKGTTAVDSDTLMEARTLDEGTTGQFESEGATANELCVFSDVHVYLDEDGDGIAELRHIQTVGEAHEFHSNEVVEYRPYALFGPDPEPHTLIGLSVADYVMDIQRIKSMVLRGTLDSLALSLNPDKEYVEGEVNVKDLLVKDIGRLVRVRRPGMTNTVVTPFMGKEALPVLQYLDEAKRDRTGPQMQTLDPDALQSSTKSAVDASITAAQQRVELIARIFAETGMREMFRGLLRLMVQHPDPNTVVRLRGNFVAMDPTDWNADKDVTVNVALGAGMPDDKVQILQQAMAKQEQLLQAGAPIVSFVEYRKTLARLLEFGGYVNPDEFFKPFGPEQQQAYDQQQAQAAQQPDEVDTLREVEMAKLQLKAKELQLMDDRERDKIARDFVFQMQKLEAETGVKMETATLTAQVDLERQALDRDVAAAQVAERMMAPTGGGGREDS